MRFRKAKIMKNTKINIKNNCQWLAENLRD